MMMTGSAPLLPLRHAIGRSLHHLPSVIVLILAVAVAVLVASSYLGNSTSPYGTCYAPSGRSIPCAAVKR